MIVTRLITLSLLLSLIACGSAKNQPMISDSLPNIVLIVVDDLGWIDVGYMGSKVYETPNIDKLAKQGMYFTEAYAAAAVCSPTRAALMTGKYPARLGITDWIRASFQGGGTEDVEGYEAKESDFWGEEDSTLLCPKNPFHLKREEITVAERLHMAGYTSCHIGKWHLGSEKYYPTYQGFDYNIAGCDYGQPPNYFDPYVYGNWYGDSLWGFPTMAVRDSGEYLTDREAFEAVQFIENHKDKPFFLSLCHYAVHTPIQGKVEDVSYFAQKSDKLGIEFDTAYAAMIKSVDEAVEQVIAKLETLSLLENTLIIFTSDNGGRIPTTDNTPLRSGKGYPYEGGLRVPLIASWKGKIKSNTTSSVPVISMDIFSTICEVAGVQISKYHSMDGESLLPILLQKDALTGLDRTAIYWHFPHYRTNDIVPYSIIRHGSWKLIKQYDSQPFQLFNLEEDLSETTDLSETHPEKVAALERQLNQWLDRVGAKLPKVEE